MSEFPFQNLRFCSTGIPSKLRSEIAHQIKAMGGQHVSNLMSDVNYLIVGDDKETEKYHFCIAKRADIHFVSPAFIEKVHQDWINGRDVDLSYKLPLFEGMKICLSRVNKDEYCDLNRNEIEKLIINNGGSVSESLSNSNNFIITNEKSGKRYDVAVQWKLPVIHPLYVLDSIKRGASLQVKYYDITKIENIGEGSCEIWDSLDKKRKRKKIIDEDDENEVDQQLIIKKNPKIWKSIMNDQKTLLKNSKTKNNEWDENESEPIEVNNLPKISSIDVTKSSIFKPPPKSTIFKDKTFKIIYFNQSQVDTLKKVITSHSGLISDENFDYILIPSDYKIDKLPLELRKQIRSQSFLDDSITILTDWFIERSLHYKTLKIDQWGLPFNHTLIPDKDKILPNLKICISGFQGIELLHLTKLIKLIPNFNVFDILNKEKDVLIVNIDLFKTKKTQGSLILKYPTLFNQDINSSDVNMTSLKSTNNKMNFAKKSSIPIISISFLFEVFLNKTDFLININNKNWCLHCPKPDKLNNNLKQLLLRSERDEELEKQKLINDKEKEIIPDSLDSTSSIPKLPSPMRNKRANIGRLVGRASISQFNLNNIEDIPHLQQPDFNQKLNNSKNNNNNNNTSDDDYDKLDGMRMTQIGYEDENDTLMKLMNGETVNDNKSKENIDTNRKRTTRAVYKELMHMEDK